MKDMIDGRYTSIRQFDNFVQLASFRRAEQCGMNGGCSQQFVVEGDGAVYPCDFYCLDEYLAGNINRMSFRELAESPARGEIPGRGLRPPRKVRELQISQDVQRRMQARAHRRGQVRGVCGIFRLCPASYETHELTPRRRSGVRQWSPERRMI